MGDSYTEDPFGSWEEGELQPAAQVGSEVVGVLGENYRVLDVRRGGMGEVYICQIGNDPSGAKIALKTFQKRLFLDRPSRHAFLREASIWARLSGLPHILPAMGVEMIDGRPFVRMPVLEPGLEQFLSLRQRIENGPVDSIEAATIAFQIARGLTEGAEKVPGLIHGDLKPDNLLYAGEDILVSDFGLARALGDEVQAGSTWAYQAPEIWSSGGLATPASDIYAFGIVVYELLTGSLPLSATTREDWSLAHRNASVSAPTDFPLEGLEADLMKLSLDCQAKSADDRPHSFQAVSSEISETVDRHDPVAALMMLVDAVRAKQRYQAIQQQIMPDIVCTLIELGESELALDELGSLADELCEGELAIHYGSALSLVNRDEEAIPMFERGIAGKLDEPMQLHARSEYGLSLKRVGRYNEAIEVFQALLPFLPESELARSVSNLATVYLVKGDHAAVVDTLEPLVRKQQDSAEAWANLGLGYEGLARWQEAAQAMQKALRLAPQHSQLLIGLARIHLYGFSNVEQARKTLMLAFDQGYDSTEWYKLLQACHFLLDEKENAAELREALLQNLDPGIVDLLTDEALDIAREVAQSASTPAADEQTTRSEESQDENPEFESADAPKAAERTSASGFRMPQVNYRSYADQSTGFDFYYDPDAADYVDKLVEGWGQIERDPRIAKYNSQFRGTPVYFTQCPRCELLIATNRDPRARLRCKHCDTVHQTTPIERPDLAALIEQAERRLGKEIEELESICHLLFVWPSNADYIETLTQTAVAMDFRPVEDARRALLTLEAAGNTVPGIDSDEAMIAVASKPESLRLYRGATPPTVNALLSELRDVDRDIRTMGTDYEPGSFHPLSVLLESRQFEIEQAARQMLAENPDNPQSLLFLIEALRMQEKYDEALTRAREAADLWPLDATNWSTLGMIQLQLNLVNDAIDAFERCLEMDPIDRNTMVVLAAALRSKGEEARAREWESKAQGLGGIGF